MSILHISDEGWVLCHKDYISNVYKATLNDSKTQQFSLRNDLFDIRYPFISKEFHAPLEIDEPFLPSKKRKRLAKKMSIELDPKIKQIKEKFTKLVESAKNSNLFQESYLTKSICGNLQAREAAVECSSCTELMGVQGLIKGGNNSSQAVLQRFEHFGLMVPPNCRFICGDVRKTVYDIHDESFDLVLMDPPWWNKYIRRLKKSRPDLSYNMLYNHEIESLPIAPVLSSAALIAVWCTNCEAHERTIIDEMFKKWTVKYVATWYWMKVTKAGEPICPFTNGNGKQPFERIIIGSNMEDDSALKITNGKIIVSIPSALHSHKPPLNDLLLPFLKEDSRCLEIFARYLLPNTTSLGLEPLRWQHDALFTLEESQN